MSRHQRVTKERIRRLEEEERRVQQEILKVQQQLERMSHHLSSDSSEASDIEEESYLTISRVGPDSEPQGAMAQQGHQPHEHALSHDAAKMDQRRNVLSATLRRQERRFAAAHDETPVTTARQPNTSAKRRDESAVGASAHRLSRSKSRSSRHHDSLAQLPYLQEEYGDYRVTQRPSGDRSLDHRLHPSSAAKHHDYYSPSKFAMRRREVSSDSGSSRSYSPPRSRGSRRSKESGDGASRIKPPTFDGKSRWTDFLVQFEMVADVNGWKGKRRAVELAACLRDSAVGILSLMQREERLHFPSLVRALQERFEPANLVQMHQATLKTRVRRHGETLTFLGAEIKKLVGQAYPDAEGSMFNQLTLASFLDALGDADMEWAVRQGQPRSVDAAVALAMQYEAFQKARSRDPRGNGIMAVRANESQDTDDHKENMQMRRRQRLCFGCNKPGHLIRNCPEKKKASAASDQEN